MYMEPDGDRNEQTCEEMESLVQCCPRLSGLIITAHLTSNYKMHSLSRILSYAKEPSLFSNIISIRLKELDIQPDQSVEFPQVFDLYKLRELSLSDCDYIIPLLDSLSSFYTHSTGELRAGSITLPDGLDQPAGTIESIERLLRVCPKLGELELDLYGNGFINVTPIVSHFDILYSLVAETGGPETNEHYSVVDIQVMLKACTKLKWLGIFLPTVELGSITEISTNSRLVETDPAAAEFASMLVRSIVNRR
jgi:hypothetical protein